jgi:hypothetical protein
MAGSGNRVAASQAEVNELPDRGGAEMPNQPRVPISCSVADGGG